MKEHRQAQYRYTKLRLYGKPSVAIMIWAKRRIKGCYDDIEAADLVVLVGAIPHGAIEVGFGTLSPEDSGARCSEGRRID